ncbi:hypothetical protein TNCV_2808971 [Trichonephila clavipes]|nr:hypothetical protein TNCV_2808971 [Trichonephila clavipes]
MPDSPSQMISDMLDWRHIWGLGSPRKGSNIEFPRFWHHLNRFVYGWASRSTRNGSRDPKRPSARHPRSVQKDTRTPSEGTTCDWEWAADKAVLTMLWSS